MKKLIAGMLGLALAGLFAVQVNAKPIAGVYTALHEEFRDVMNTRKVAGVFADLERMYERVQNEEKEVVEVLDVEAIAHKDRWNIQPVLEYMPVYPEDELNLIALLTEAEAEGEPEYGKRLVIDVVINRMLSGSFPNTVREVIFHKGQFESMWNGRTNHVSATPETRQLVLEELRDTTNRQVLYFRTKHYFSGQTQLCNVGHHYFSR